MPKPNWGGGATGAVSGAATGSAFGPIGTVAGGIIGGVAGLFGGGKKKKKKPKKLSTLDSRQQQLNEQQHDSILGKGPLADLYNYNPDMANDFFDKAIANPEYRNFREKIAPTITGSFRSEGLQNSSYSGDALAKAGRDIEESLAGRRAELQFNQFSNTQNAKRNAVENLQNRQTFAYQPNDQSQQGSGGFGLDNILNSVSGKDVDNALGWVQDQALKYLPGGV